MKNLLIITTIMLLNYTFGYDYCQNVPKKSVSAQNYFYSYPRVKKYNNYYCTPNNYGVVYPYKKTNNNIEKMRILKKLQYMQKRNSNYLTWNNKKGALTGYSVPVSKKDLEDDYDDIYYDYNTNKKINMKNSGKNINKIFKTPSLTNYPKNSNCTTELYSMPTTNTANTKRGYSNDAGGGISGSTGVKIIWD